MRDEQPGGEHYPLWRLFLLFLRIGSTAFGGFMSLISIIQIELVDRRRAILQEDLLNGISLASVLPGPMAVNVAAYAGFRLRGVAGAFTSIVAVVLPSFLLVLLATELYLRWGGLPLVREAFIGFIPAVTAIIVQAGWNIGRKTIRAPIPLLLALLASLAIVLVGGYYVTLGTIAAAGLLGLVLFRRLPAEHAEETQMPPGRRLAVGWQLVFGLVLLAALLPFLLALPRGMEDSIARLLSTFSGMSLTLFGGGYVFIPMIQKIVVEGYGWVTLEEFNAAIAIGQITPGPILISATFIGYKVLGVTGAVVATAGIFLPPAILILLAAQALAYIQESALVRRVLLGIRIAVCGMIFAAAAVTGMTAQLHWGSAAIFALALLGLLRFKLAPVWIVLGAGVAGILLYAW